MGRTFSGYPTRPFRWPYGLLAGLLLLLLSRCGPDAVAPNPGSGPAGEPRLLGLTLAGIPADHIRIDQNLRRVVVTIPASLSATGVVPILQLTPNTTVDYGNSSLFSNDKNQWLLDTQTLRIVSDTKKAATYQFVTRAAGDMAFAPYTGPREVSMEAEPSSLCFPIYNFRDSVACGFLTLTNVATARRREFFLCPGSTCQSTRQTDGAVVLSLLVEHNVVDPGEYTVSVRKENGRTATLPQTLTVRKGRVVLSAEASPVLVDSASFVLTGYNLYEDSRLSLRLTNAAGETFQAPLVVGGFRRTAAAFRTPPQLKPGYYYAQLFQDEQPTAALVRLVVIRDARTLFIQRIAESGTAASAGQLLTPSAPFTTPLVVRRGKTYAIQTSVAEVAAAASSPVRPQLRFISLTNPAEQYTVMPQADSSVLFSIPATLPAGRYRLVYQQLQGAGSVDALPLERDVVVE